MKILDFIKKYWYWIIILSLIPFITEFIIFHSPTISRFENETWFSFMGSYIGAIMTLVVMLLTFKKSDNENKRIIALQKRQRQIDLQNEKIVNIIHTLLLDKYVFSNLDTVGENMERFYKELQYVQLDTLMLSHMEDGILKNEKLVKELFKLQTEEIQVLNRLYDIAKKQNFKEIKDDPRIIFLKTGQDLNEKANAKREEIKLLYDNYLEKVYNTYYE